MNSRAPPRQSQQHFIIDPNFSLGIRGIPEECAQRFTRNGNEKAKAALEEESAAEKRHIKLRAKSKAKAKASAKRAGRPYPNLVDNMNSAKTQRNKKSKKKTR